MNNYLVKKNIRFSFLKCAKGLLIAALIIISKPLFAQDTIVSSARGKYQKDVSYNRKKRMIEDDFSLAKYQYQNMLEQATDLTLYPRSMQFNGSIKFVNIKDWTGGFWAGNLWLLYEYTHDDKWKQAATKWTESLENNQFNTSNHDLGFMMYCSYGNAYRLTGNENYKKVLIQSAKSLCSRFNPKVGCIKSWNARLALDKKTKWDFPVIIDNMINLELLFFASKVTGDPYYKNIAIRHAETTLKNHIRPDFSTYHVVNYDTITGRVLNKQTFQGYSDNSTWARGQAWGIYGFTMMFRETHDRKFLLTAKALADFYLNNVNLPKDKIPYWDFNANQKGYTPDWKYDSLKNTIVPRDASAAAIVSSGLFELSGYLGSVGKKYQEAAVQILNTLSSDEYLAPKGKNANFLIQHAVGNFPAGSEIDVPIVYADYYFLEALIRYQKLLKPD
jgi:unsaturated chondroitin disaccharide hydrolase